MSVTVQCGGNGAVKYMLWEARALENLSHQHSPPLPPVAGACDTAFMLRLRSAICLPFHQSQWHGHCAPPVMSLCTAFNRCDHQVGLLVGKLLEFTTASRMPLAGKSFLMVFYGFTVFFMAETLRERVCHGLCLSAGRA